jgi:hypothetical protein
MNLSTMPFEHGAHAPAKLPGENILKSGLRLLLRTPLELQWYLKIIHLVRL